MYKDPHEAFPFPGVTSKEFRRGVPRPEPICQMQNVRVWKATIPQLSRAIAHDGHNPRRAAGMLNGWRHAVSMATQQSSSSSVAPVIH